MSKSIWGDANCHHSFFVAINADVAEMGVNAVYGEAQDYALQCEAGWVAKSEEFPRDFAYADSREFTIDLPIEGQDSAYIRTIADVDISGVAKFIAHYEVKQTWFCLPYMFRYVKSEIRGPGARRASDRRQCGGPGCDLHGESAGPGRLRDPG